MALSKNPVATVRPYFSKRSYAFLYTFLCVPSCFVLNILKLSVTFLYALMRSTVYARAFVALFASSRQIVTLTPAPRNPRRKKKKRRSIRKIEETKHMA